MRDKAGVYSAGGFGHRTKQRNGGSSAVDASCLFPGPAHGLTGLLEVQGGTIGTRKPSSILSYFVKKSKRQPVFARRSLWKSKAARKPIGPRSVERVLGV